MSSKPSIMSDYQYYWFTPEEIALITDKLGSASENQKTSENIIAELKVSDVRSDTSNIPMARLGDALGLESGSKPLWLSSEEYNFLSKLIA